MQCLYQQFPGPKPHSQRTGKYTELPDLPVTIYFASSSSSSVPSNFKIPSHKYKSYGSDKIGKITDRLMETHIHKRELHLMPLTIAGHKISGSISPPEGFWLVRWNVFALNI